MYVELLVSDLSTKDPACSFDYGEHDIDNNFGMFSFMVVGNHRYGELYLFYDLFKNMDIILRNSGKKTVQKYLQTMRECSKEKGLGLDNIVVNAEPKTVLSLTHPTDTSAIDFGKAYDSMREQVNSAYVWMQELAGLNKPGGTF